MTYSVNKKTSLEDAGICKTFHDFLQLNANGKQKIISIIDWTKFPYECQHKIVQRVYVEKISQINALQIVRKSASEKITGNSFLKLSPTARHTAKLRK